MYFSALEFLEEEREAWRPYEALAGLTDDQLEMATDPTGPAHGWSGRDLVAHMVGWLELTLDVARELAIGEHSPAKDRLDTAWEEQGDAYNESLHASWRELPLTEVRRRLATVPGELRGTLTVVPEARWLKNPVMLRFFEGDTIEHEVEHIVELEAILAAAGGGGQG